MTTSSRFTAAVLLAALAGTSACHKSNHAEAGSAEAAVLVDPAAVNALVPANLKAALAFEKTDVVSALGRDKVTFTLAAPRGWKQLGKMFARLNLDDHSMTSISLASDCGGSCTPKDWAATADSVVFKQFADATVAKNEVTATSRLVIATRADLTFVAYAWWLPTAKHYRYCVATLEGELQAAAPAFAKACQAVAVAGEN